MSCPLSNPEDYPTHDEWAGHHQAEVLEEALKQPHCLDLTRTLPWRLVWQTRCCVCSRWLTDREASSCTVHEELARCGECAFAKVSPLEVPGNTYTLEQLMRNPWGPR